MSFSTKQALRLALVAACAVSVTACASRPKLTPAPTPAPAPSYPAPPAPPPANPGPVPGSEQDFVINIGDRVYFDFDRYEIRTDAAPVLGAQAQWLLRYPNVTVRIEGNADERGTREYNLALGARRANSVREFLVAHGVQATRITTVSFGKERPIDPGVTEDSYQRNRNGHTAITGGAR